MSLHECAGSAEPCQLFAEISSKIVCAAHFIFIESLHSDSTGISGIEVSSKLQQLARKQRMNTDLRRNIFYIIMTSEVSLKTAHGILSEHIHKKACKITQ